MNLRPLLIVLVFVNLAFAAWALLIDRPPRPPAARDISHLPRLTLANEASAAVHASAATTAAVAPPSGHCVTVGPFADLNAAAAAAALLQSRGFPPTQRDEPGPDLIAYWVYLDNVASDAAATQVLQKLHSGGLSDAHVMPATAGEPRRISVGLFNEHDGAERRSQMVKSMGLTPVVTEQHQSQATYWVDINLTSPGQSVPTEGLLPAGAGAHLEIRDCPVPTSSAPAASSAPKT